MDRRVRARVLLAEAEALGLTLEDLVTASAGLPLPMSSAPILAEVRRGDQTNAIGPANAVTMPAQQGAGVEGDAVGQLPGDLARDRRCRPRGRQGRRAAHSP